MSFHYRRFPTRSLGIDTGSLKVGVYAVDIGRPAPGATVTITPRGEADMILDELRTDNSGQSDTIELAAPPIEYSLDPNGGKPYSEYDLRVSMDGFDSVTIEGVQIFSGSKALQDVRLYPLDEPAPALDTIIIQPEVLWGDYPPKIPEDEVKELPPSSGFVVLPEPVIPQTVVVHNGVPTNTSAQNYWVPFTDYIKNVASCEIYSTWPVETIRANILAILSFTLNRVYTEWYRNMGYSFTITNSTQFDHAFNYGRNIFEEISVVVDDIFTSYITRPNIKQPLFAQYCDGKRSQCPMWMTQWGSKDLGDRGETALNILKHYYGSDVYITQAQKVDGTPMSYPNAAQLKGSSGAPVRTIQEQLNAISNNYPAIPKQKVDGIYGDATTEAVRTFQRIFNLPQSGIVDYATWYKLSEIFVAVTRIAELT
ncbi:MAG: peptidoglycan-binding protein [Clostridiales bacterium]|nr:peptidoglycan-binding protein [Clostridiales bacterium]